MLKPVWPRLAYLRFNTLSPALISLSLLFQDQKNELYVRTSSGEKIKFYFVATKSEAENNVFGYLNGSYPYEIAPPINYDEQFNRTILDPVNRFIEAMGYPPLAPNLLLVRALF